MCDWPVPLQLKGADVTGGTLQVAEALPPISPPVRPCSSAAPAMNLKQRPQTAGREDHGRGALKWKHAANREDRLAATTEYDGPKQAE
jgi:hypothetical protein